MPGPRGRGGRGRGGGGRGGGRGGGGGGGGNNNGGGNQGGFQGNNFQGNNNQNGFQGGNQQNGGGRPNRHGNPRQNQQNNNQNQNGNKQFNCRNCGPNNTHPTKQCNKGGNNNRNNGNGNGNGNGNNGNNNTNGRNKDRKNNQRNNNSQEIEGLYCARCGNRWHNERTCTAGELPQEDWCICGSMYHRHHECPWDHDPEVREQYQDHAQGLLCRWCKNESDGLHTVDSCKALVRFRSELRGVIRKQYDGLQWCWHCRSTDHKTRACNSALAKTGVAEWDAKVEDIITEWLEIDASELHEQRLKAYEDESMGGPESPWTAPDASTFNWCIHCKHFGHSTNNSDYCDTREFEEKRPHKRPAARPYHSNQDHPMTSYTPLAPIPELTTSQKPLRRNCLQPACNGKLFFSDPCPPTGEIVTCSKCHHPCQHPAFTSYTTHNNLTLASAALALGNPISNLDIIALLRHELAQSQSQSQSLHHHAQPQKRPSAYIPKSLAFTQWPASQPRYEDYGLKNTLGDPIFARNDTGITLYDIPGNMQTYFPPFQIQLNFQHLEESVNENLAINRVALQGLDLGCARCARVCVVLDDEEDVVMKGTGGANVLGCGRGYWGFVDGMGMGLRGTCSCAAFLYGGPAYVWHLAG